MGQSKNDIFELKDKYHLLSLQVIQLQQALEDSLEKNMILEKSVEEYSNASCLMRTPEYECFRSFNVVSRFHEGDYKNLQVRIDGYNHGNESGPLLFKLVISGERAGLEFRYSELYHSLISEWADDQKDEYGKYFILYLPISDCNNDPTMVFSNSSDKVAVIKLIRELYRYFNDLRFEALKNFIDTEEFFLWRNAVVDLYQNIPQLQSGLTIDQVELREFYKAGSYQHIWIELANLEFEDLSFESYSFKIIFNEENQEIYLEFRELNPGVYPFRFWSPKLQDDFGWLAILSFNFVGQQVVLEANISLSQADKRFIICILNNLSRYFDILRSVQLNSDVDWGFWSKNLSFLNNNELLFTYEINSDTSKKKGFFEKLLSYGRK